MRPKKLLMATKYHFDMREPIFVLILILCLAALSMYAGVQSEKSKSMEDKIVVIIDTKVLGIYESVSAAVRGLEGDYYESQPIAKSVAPNIDSIPAINTVTHQIKHQGRYDRLLFLGTNSLSLSIQKSKMR